MFGVNQTFFRWWVWQCRAGFCRSLPQYDVDTSLYGSERWWWRFGNFPAIFRRETVVVNFLISRQGFQHESGAFIVRCVLIKYSHHAWVTCSLRKPADCRSLTQFAAAWRQHIFIWQWEALGASVKRCLLNEKPTQVHSIWDVTTWNDLNFKMKRTFCQRGYPHATNSFRHKNNYCGKVLFWLYFLLRDEEQGFRLLFDFDSMNLFHVCL